MLTQTGSMQTAQKAYQKTVQKLTFTHQLGQSIALLSHTVMQLRHEVLDAVTVNPALEIREEPDHDSLEEIQYKKRSGEDANKHFEFIENMLASPQTLREYLLRQLHLSIDDETQIAIGTRIIENLNEYGFCLEEPAQLCKDIAGAGSPLIAQVMAVIQSFDPVGCGTANAVNSLAVQISHLPVSEEEKNQLRECIALIETAASAAAEQPAIVKRIDSFIASHNIQKHLHVLTPYPGLAYNPNITPVQEQYIVPDAVVIQEDGELRVKINTDIVPVVDINPEIQKAAHSKDKETADFASRLIASAQSFITGLQYRSSSLEKVVLFIARVQSDFFTGAQEYPNPLTRKEIAKALELSESTVSRIVSGKYIQTPRGILAMKHFLSHSVGAVNTSAAQIGQMIQKILQAHEKKSGGKSISDENIAQLLAHQGINIARRTVAKYRKKLGIQR